MGSAADDKDKPEQILVADGDSREDDTISVDDLDINGLRMTDQIHDTIGHKPNEEAARSNDDHQPNDAEHPNAQCSDTIITLYAHCI